MAQGIEQNERRILAYDYGVRGDGITDDGPAWNAAIAAAWTLGGAVVDGMDGVTSLINTTILIRDNVTLRGYNTTLKAGPNLTGPVVQNIDQTNGNTLVEVIGLKIDGNRTVVPTTATDCLNLVKCDDARISGCIVQNAYRDGLHLDTCKRPIIDLQCNANGRHGAYLNTVTFATGNLVTVNNGQRTSGNGLTLDTTSTDNALNLGATDTQGGSATQVYGVQEVAASGCTRNVFFGSANGNVTGASSFVGTSSLFTASGTTGTLTVGILATGGLSTAIATKTANYPMTTSDNTIVASGAGTTITLPNAPPNGTEVTVKRVDASNAITVSRAGTDVIELAGATANTRSLNSNGAAISLVYNGGTWNTYGTIGTVA